MSLRGVARKLQRAFKAARAHIRANYPGFDLYIVSGYRSPARQRELRARWDRGDRRGLVYRPAAVSRHSTGRALDIGWIIDGRPVPVRGIPVSAWTYLAALMAPYGVVWGGQWNPPDLPHFELP